MPKLSGHLFANSIPPHEPAVCSCSLYICIISGEEGEDCFTAEFSVGTFASNLASGNLVLFLVQFAIGGIWTMQCRSDVVGLVGLKLEL